MDLFNDIIGHNDQKKILIRLLQKNKVPHLILFSGPDGIGKYQMAFEFAKALQCREDEFYCGKCEICRLHMDIQTITKDNKMIKIDQLRDLQSSAGEKPYKADRKIFIIKDAEYMNEEAMNSSLRIFEEPYSHVLIILTVKNMTRLLPTIVSRCFTIDFFHLKKEETAQILQEKLKFGEEEISKYLSITDRSLEYTQYFQTSYFDQLYCEGKYEIYENLIKNCNYLIISKILDTIYKNDILLFINLFIDYLMKNKRKYLNLLNNRYNLLIRELIDLLQTYESYNVNESIFISSMLIRIKEVLNNNYE